MTSTGKHGGRFRFYGMVLAVADEVTGQIGLWISLQLSNLIKHKVLYLQLHCWHQRVMVIISVPETMKKCIVSVTSIVAKIVMPLGPKKVNQIKDNSKTDILIADDKVCNKALPDRSIILNWLFC